jgi:hypothetical protein
MKNLFAIRQGGWIYSPLQIMMRLLLLLVVVIVVDILAASRAFAQSTLPRPDHVVVVIEENQAYPNVIGSPNAPYINSLAKSGALFVNSSAITHPSEPNYLAFFSGSAQGVTDDSCPFTFSSPNLGGELLKAGLSFGGYSESMPNAGYTGCEYASLYARKHNPWVNFTDVPSSDNLPWTSFPTNYATLPTISIVVPNLQNDMHDGTVQQGDTWLQQHIDSYVQWAKTHNSLLMVTWDEDDGSTANHIPTFTVGPMVKTGSYSEAITHYGVLRTLEDMYSLPHASNSASAQPITDCWQ